MAMSIVLTVFSVSLISTILATLVVLADKVLNNYGECEIDINDGDKTFMVTGGSNLLSTLASSRIYIPSACGGKATCGLCKVRLGSEVGAVLPTEEPYLTKEEIDANVRLSCQVKVKSSLKLYIPEELFNVREYKAKIVRITRMTRDIKEFQFALVNPASVAFKAGQYIQVVTKPYANIKESVMRAYSISSLPTNNQELEIIVRLVPGGVCTTFMHEYLQEGDELSLRGPFGEFYLHEGGDTLVFIAGGSGLAPIKSMVFDILRQKLDKKLIFFFGAVTKQDLYYVDLFTKLDAEHDNFQYVPALSQPDISDEWEGEIGLITEVVGRYITDTADMQAYLCGSPGMIDACIRVLEKAGLSQADIYYDEF